MTVPRTQTTIDPEDGEDGASVSQPSIWDTLGDDDRASIERGLAQSLAGPFATDEEVETAFATFGP